VPATARHTPPGHRGARPCRLSRATRVTSDANAFELVHHRVDGVLELEDLRLSTSTGDLARQVAAAMASRHVGDVAHLAPSGSTPLELTESVQFFSTLPATSGTAAWPPSLALRAHLGARTALSLRRARKAFSWSTESCWMASFSWRISPRTIDVTVIFFDQVAVGHGDRHLGDCCAPTRQVPTPSSCTCPLRVPVQVPATPRDRRLAPSLPSVPTFARHAAHYRKRMR
jgi:hypothetical protein